MARGFSYMYGRHNTPLSAMAQKMSTIHLNLLLDPSDRATCVAELNLLQKEILPQLTDNDSHADTSIDSKTVTVTRKLLQSGCGSAGLGRCLLSIVGSHAATEICRERASIVLKGLLQRASSRRRDDNDGTNDDPDWSGWLMQFYIDCCSTVCRRIAPACPHPQPWPPTPDTSSYEEKRIETSEQIRLQLIFVVSHLLSLLLERPKEEEANEATSICQASSQLCFTMVDGGTCVLLDPYPDLHRESCRFLLSLADLVPSVLVQHASALLAKLLGCGDDGRGSPNGASLLDHRHAKTRCLALDVSSAIICCCAADTVPDIALLVGGVLMKWEGTPIFDRSAQVRISLQKAVGNISRKLGASYFFEDSTSGSSDSLVASTQTEFQTSAIGSRLLSLLLKGIGDEVESVKRIASDEISLLAVTAFGEGADIGTLLAPLPYSILMMSFRDAARPWSVERRAAALRTATVLLQFLAESDGAGLVLSTGDSVLIVAALSSCFQEDSVSITVGAASCAFSFGKCGFTAIPLLSVILDSLESQYGESAIDASANEKKNVFLDIHFASALSLLESLLRGCASTNLDETKDANECLGYLRTADISSALCCEAVLAAIFVDKAIASSLYAVCDAFVETVRVLGVYSNCQPSSRSDMVVNLLSCSMYLLAACKCSSDSHKSSKDVSELLDKIRSISGDNDSDSIFSQSDLMRVYFQEVLASLVPADSPLESHQLQAFDALIRICGGNIVGTNFNTVGPIFEVHLGFSDALEEGSALLQQDSSVYSTKMSLMALLESVVSDTSFSPDQSCICYLIDDIIAPNLIWRVGGKATALRRVSLAALFSVLRVGNVTETTMISIAPRLLPVLNSMLPDGDESTRELVCRSLAIIVKVAACCLGEDSTQEICLSMTKCLEDNADSVRIAACSALAAFLVAGPETRIRGEVSKHVVEELQMHSKDPNATVGDAVKAVLMQTVPRAAD